MRRNSTEQRRPLCRAAPVARSTRSSPGVLIANRQPGATRTAATAYGFPFDYTSRPNRATYQTLLAFAERVRRDQEDLGPRDMIDLQSFIWVQGSDEY
jgi:hypothetical protein